MSIVKAVGATTALVAATTNALSNVGPAAAAGAAIASAFGLGGGQAKVKLPLPNILSTYASYNYILGLGVLTDNEVNNPDTTYMKGKSIPLICKSGGTDPNNRIKTAYGKFDFFIDNLIIDSLIGYENKTSTNATSISFEVIEPYSMGMFILACQTAAYQNGHQNWHDAPFLLTVEFRGNKGDGSMSNIPGTKRYISMKFASLEMKVSEKGAVYQCTAIPWNVQASTTTNSNLKTDVSIQGKTVQEMLQTGEKSLQKVINDRLKDLKKEGIVDYPDEVLILFPTDISSAGSAPGTGSKENSSGKATVNPSASSSPSGGAGDLYKKLGVVDSPTNATKVQPVDQCNALGKASMNFGPGAPKDSPFAKESDTYDEKSGTWKRGNLVINPKDGNFRFTQGSDIPNAINQVMLASNYAKETLDPAKLSKTGMTGWWKIDTQVFTVTTDVNYKSTGKKPKIIVYRVVPYEVHSSKQTATNATPPGYDELKKQAVKHYDYIYTGKNTEIINFNIEYNVGFMSSMAADQGNKTADAKTAKQQGSKVEKVAANEPIGDGNKPPDKLGVQSSQNNYDKTKSNTDGKGGGGSDTAATRAARVFHDAIANPLEMVNLDMEILGDPYFFAQSGQSNYTSKPNPQHSNLNADGTVNWQNGEVDIIVRFKTPIDINPGTGLYKFSGGASAPVVGFEGLYKVTTLVNKFSGGKFTQTISGFRRPRQESKKAPEPDKTTNASKAEAEKGKK